MNVRSEEFGLSFVSGEFLPISPLDLAFVVFDFFVFFGGKENIFCKKKIFNAFFKLIN